MPIHQAESHVSRAEEHIAFLKAHYPNVSNLRTDLTPVFDQFVAQIPPTDKSTYEMALANTRARLRNDNPLLLCRTRRLYSGRHR